MLNKQDLEFFENALTKSEVNEIIGDYNRIENNSMLRENMIYLYRSEDFDKDASFITDDKMSIIALMCQVLYDKSMECLFENNIVLGEKCADIHEVLTEYFMANANESDIDVFEYLNQ